MDREDDPTVWCGNLAPDVTEELLYELFLQAGPVNRVTIPKDKEGRRRNYGFVTFKHAISIPYALELFSDTCLFDEPLRLKNRGGATLDNHQILANYNHLATSPGNFAHVRNGYVAKVDQNEQCLNRRHDPVAGYQRNRNYDAQDSEWYNDRDNRRDAEMHGRQSGRRYGGERDAYGSGRTQRDAYSGERGQRDQYGSERRNQRNAFGGERNQRDAYGGESIQRDSYNRERNYRDAQSVWMGRGSRDLPGTGVPWPPTSPGNNFSVDRIPNFESVVQKIPQRTKMVLPKPTQQSFMATTGITQMSACWSKEK